MVQALVRLAEIHKERRCIQIYISDLTSQVFKCLYFLQIHSINRKHSALCQSGSVLANMWIGLTDGRGCACPPTNVNCVNDTD